jgi:hypothetical protein
LISELRFEISELKEKQEDLAFVGACPDKSGLSPTSLIKNLKKERKEK